MKRASYKEGVAWIALNDEPMEVSLSTLKALISVCLLADLFGKEPDEVAREVRRYRCKQDSLYSARVHAYEVELVRLAEAKSVELESKGSWQDRIRGSALRGPGGGL